MMIGNKNYLSDNGELTPLAEAGVSVSQTDCKSDKASISNPFSLKK